MNTEDAKSRFCSKLSFMVDKDSEDFKYVYNIFANQVDTIEHLKRKIACQEYQLSIDEFNARVASRRLASVDKRKLVVQLTEKSTAKIKINPCNGNVLLKISNKSSEKSAELIKKLANVVMKSEAFLPFTYRGTIHYVPSNDAICVTMSLRSECEAVMKNYAPIKFSLSCK